MAYDGLINKWTRDGTAEPVRETKLSGANGDREIFIFPVQLTTSRIGNLTRLILTLAICVAIHIRNIYVWSALTAVRAWINRVWFPILLVVS